MTSPLVNRGSKAAISDCFGYGPLAAAWWSPRMHSSEIVKANVSEQHRVRVPATAEFGPRHNLP